jgi:hypothetical protein
MTEDTTSGAASRRSSQVHGVDHPTRTPARALLYTYVDVGSLGPLPNMYEPTWALPGKRASAVSVDAEELLGDHPAEGVPDEDGRLGQPPPTIWV